MPFPISPQCLVVESHDGSKSERARETDDVLPFFVTLKDVTGEPVELFPSPSVLEDLPHTEKSIYTVFGMSMFN